MMPDVKMAPASLRSDRLSRDMSIVLDWLRDYVSEPSQHIGRTGPVCPFVPAALKVNAIRFSFRYEVDACDAAELQSLVRSELREFKRSTDPPSRSGTSLHSLLVVLPDATEEGWEQIDRTYGGLKDAAVSEGLMIGQFHPVCAEGAVRNPVFPVSRSPIALYAIRYMAPHDALFLHDGREWFQEYEARFAEHPTRPRTDPLIRDLYQSARHRYGSGSDCGR